MKSRKYLPRLERMVGADLSTLEKKVIVIDDGVYHVFGKYQIRPKNSMFVVSKYNQVVEEFGALRVAMAWCSADQLQKSHLSHNIIDLERQRRSELADLAARSHMAKKMQDAVRREAVLLKVEHRKECMKFIENQLDKCVNLAKYWQIQGFNNETARIGRTASNRTN